MKKLTKRITDPKMLEPLTAAVRQEVFLTVKLLGEASTSDVANQLGMARDRVNYHMGLLENAGLVKQVGKRPGSRRPERLFAWAEPEMRFGFDAPRSRTLLLKALKSMFQLAHKEIQALVAHEPVELDGLDRTLGYGHWRATLSREDARRVNKVLAELGEIMENNQATQKSDEVPKELYAVTATFAKQPKQ